MKKFLVFFLGLSAISCFAQLNTHELLNTKITTTKTKDGVFLQRDLTKYIGLVASQTNKNVHAGNEDQQWATYFNRPHPNVATLEKYFKNAAKEFGVPTELLMAIGQVENNWTQVGPSIDQGWGIMHLVDNSYCSTLREAAALLKLDPQQLKDNARQNIRGAAALIKKYGGNKKHKKTEDWFEASKKFSGLINEDLREQQALRYYEVLKNGAVAPTVWDETITIAPHPQINVDSKITKKTTPAKSSDYSPAVSSFISCNYTSGRGGVDIDTWVHHYVGVGTYAGAISWFHNCDAEASAHFVIRSSDGQITQCVAVADKAWHCGASGYPLNNSRSIGVEHEATASNPSLWNSTPMLQASATMVCYFADLYDIPASFHNSPGICGHQEMPGTNTSCPGAMPWTTWINYFNACSGTAPTGPTSLACTQSACPDDNVTFSWTNSGTGWHIDVSTSSSFSTYYWKFVSGLTSFTGPTGFVDHADGVTPLVFQEGTTYYWRITAGSNIVSGPTFTIHTCTTLPANPTVTVAQCPANSVNFSWANSGTGWHIDVSTSSSFTTYWWKYVSGLTSYTGPAGFVDHGDGVTPWTIQDGVTYYWRITAGSNYTNGASFVKPACDVTEPTTVIAAVPNWQSRDFATSFTDTDNSGGSGVSKKYYQVMDYNGTEWRANGMNGYFNDNFNSTVNAEWQTTAGAGNWIITSGQLEQTDESIYNTILSAAVAQTATNEYMYQWTGKITGTGTNRRAGLHFFASEATSSNRGDSYLVWFDVDLGNCKIYKSLSNTLSLINTYPYTIDAGTAYDYKVTYSPSSGQIKIWINTTLLASWTDPSPITSGNYISLRTGDCDGFFDNVKVRKGRGSSATITVGPYNNKDVRYQSPDSTMEACRINTIINDVHGNWSPQAAQNVKIDWTGPVTSVSTPATWQTGDFTASFIDTDTLSGVQERFYNVSYFDGTEWSANGANGFCRDDFDSTINPIWQSPTGGGTWEIISNKLNQTDEANTNSNLYAPLTQTSGDTYLYHWTGTATGSNATLKRFGLHFFVDDPTQTNRGNSYLAFFRFDQNEIEIQKGTNNVLAFVDTVTYDLTPGITYDFKVVYTPASGLINVYLNDILMLNWTDPSPITSGSYISLRSADCNAAYDNLRVYRSRGSSQLITAGTGANKDVMFENADTAQPACMIYTMAIDKVKNISSPAVINTNIDWTAPLCVTVNDGTGSDSSETTSFTTLSANWTAAADTNSGITRYWYAIGTTPGATDITGWTDNALDTVITVTGLSLIANQTYYFSVKTENGAGLESVCNSNGVQVIDASDIEESQHDPLVSVFPNPFGDNTTLSFELTGSQHIKISLVDLLGRSILLTDQLFAAGKHSIDIHAGGINIAKGLYYLKFENNEHSWVEKVVHY